MTSTDSAAFIIGGQHWQFGGGWTWELSTIVAEFSQLPSESAGSWKHRGNLLHGRRLHHAIMFSGEILVIGGYVRSAQGGYPR